MSQDIATYTVYCFLNSYNSVSLYKILAFPICHVDRKFSLPFLVNMLLMVVCIASWKAVTLVFSTVTPLATNSQVRKEVENKVINRIGLECILCVACKLALCRPSSKNCGEGVRMLYEVQHDTRYQIRRRMQWD